MRTESNGVRDEVDNEHKVCTLTLEVSYQLCLAILVIETSYMGNDNIYNLHALQTPKQI